MDADINRSLRQFAATKLKPSPECIKIGNETVQQIFNLLQQRSTFKLDRVVIAGSVGKNTAIRAFDYDCVVFVNGVLPPFTKIIQDFCDILKEFEEWKNGDDDSDQDMNDDIDSEGYYEDDEMDYNDEEYDYDNYVYSEFNNLRISQISSSRDLSISFQCNGFKIDLLPAINFVCGLNLSGADLILEQARRTLDNIASHYPYKEAKHFNTSLAESQIQFMKRQSSFVHILVRLAKFWNKSIFIDKYMAGRSTVIELIAVYAGNEFEYSNSILHAFKRFLTLVQNFRTLNMTFCTTEQWRRTPIAIRGQRPLILEPSNYYNNLVEYFDEGVVDSLVTFATETLHRLRSCFNSMTQNYTPLDLLFRPQSVYIDLNEYVPVYIRITVEDNPIGHDEIRVDTSQNGEIYARYPVCAMLKQALYTKVETFVHSSNHIIESQQLQNTIYHWFDNEVFNYRSMDDMKDNWCQEIVKNETHDDYPITFIVPFSASTDPNKQCTRALYVSLEFRYNEDEGDEVNEVPSKPIFKKVCDDDDYDS